MSKQVSGTIVDGGISVDLDANEWTFSNAVVDGITFLPEITENAWGGFQLVFDEAVTELNGKTATVVFFKKNAFNVAEATQELPVDGTLRLYGAHGQYKDIPWSVGSIIQFGSEKQLEHCNVNTSQSVAYLYYKKTNVEVLDGITFENATTMSSTFYQCNGVRFNNECRYLGTTNNEYCYYGAQNINFERELKLTGKCVATFASAASTVQFSGGIDLSAATSLDSAFHSSSVTLPNDNGLLEFTTAATDMRATFYSMGRSGVKRLYITAPNCTTCCNMAVSMSGLQEVYFDAPKCTSCLANSSLGGYRFGVCGSNSSLRKVTTIMPALTEGDYLCESAAKCVEWYGDVSSASSLNAGWSGWCLDAASVKRISETLKKWTSGTHQLSLGINKGLQNDQGVLDDVATIRNKGWTVTLQWN